MEKKLTSKEKVLHGYPSAKLESFDRNDRKMYRVVLKNGPTIGEGTNPNQAWNNAAKAVWNEPRAYEPCKDGNGERERIPLELADPCTIGEPVPPAGRIVASYDHALSDEEMATASGPDFVVEDRYGNVQLGEQVEVKPYPTEWFPPPNSITVPGNVEFTTLHTVDGVYDVTRTYDPETNQTTLIPTPRSERYKARRTQTIYGKYDAVKDKKPVGASDKAKAKRKQARASRKKNRR